ncbi:MAG: ABC transporter substrate-binding protein [Verrucomicrobiota bacterium]
MATKRIFLTILGLIGVSWLVACKSGEETGGEKKAVIGFVQGGASSDWRKAHTDSVKEEAEKRGYELKFVDGQGKQENQIQGISSLILQRVDAIILAPIVETGWDNVLKKAQQAKIPVLILDRSIQSDDSLYEGYIGADTYEEAVKAADWLVEKVDGRAKVVELQGAPGASPTVNRYKGFRDAIQDHPGIEIIASQSGDFRRSKGKEVMEALLKKHGDEIEVVYAHNDDMAIGAIQAIEEAGKKPGQDIILVSIDGVKAAFEAMVAGKLNCTVECNPLQGPAAFDAIEKILAGETIPKVTMVKDEVFDQSVAADVIDSRKY